MLSWYSTSSLACIVQMTQCYLSSGIQAILSYCQNNLGVILIRSTENCNNSTANRFWILQMLHQFGCESYIFQRAEKSTYLLIAPPVSCMNFNIDLFIHLIILLFQCICHMICISWLLEEELHLRSWATIKESYVWRKAFCIQMYERYHAGFPYLHSEVISHIIDSFEE